MKKSLFNSSVIILLVVFAVTANAQNLKADYQFQGNLNSSVAGAPAMTNLTGSGANSFVSDTIDGYARQSLRFPFNSGVAVNTAGLIPNNAYTIVMLFKVDETSGFRRVVSFDNGTTDNGAYLQNGRLEFENTANAQFFPNTYIQMVVVRETSGRVRAYRDGGFRVDVANDGGAFQITAANVLRFFQDDTLPPTEATAGNVARIRLYDAPMTTTQVRLLDRLPNVGGGEQPILFTTTRDGNSEIYTMNADGSNQRRLTFNELSDYEAKWSPDRTKIVFTRRESTTVTEQIWVMNADGSGQTLLSNSPSTNDHAPEWKPDGTKILFSRCDANSVCDLYTMNPNGSGQAIIPGGINTSGDEDRASYSPNGAKIVFFCATNTFANANICEANADGSGRIQLTNTVSPVSNEGPRYSPDGAKIAFRRQSDSANQFTSDVFVMNADGTGQTNLTPNTNIFDAAPSWSPDGTRIIFDSQRESVFVEIYTMNASDGGLVQRLTVNSVGDVPTDWYRPVIIVDPANTPFDFDGDGKADVSVFRPSEGAWYLQRSAQGFVGVPFGISTDKIVPADYDGDGKTDVAVYRSGIWYLQRSTAGFTGIAFGAADDVPVPADFDADGKAELNVFRPSNGGWYQYNLTTNATTSFAFGQAGDIPVPADYDGDGKADIAVFRGGVWYIQRSSLGFTGVTFGDAADKPVPADYDGDGRADIAVFRPSNGVWYLQRSTAGFTGIAFGLETDLPVPADYDGDGKADVSVFRNGTWYLNRSQAGFTGIAFGAATDRPVPNAFIP